jgi:DNA-binding PadR family transcriptional regulator
MHTPDRRDVDALLPLPPASFHVLVALAGEERHGYAILREVAARTGGAVQLGAGTLYRCIHRLLEQGLVEETSERPDPSLDDERRRYYRLTPLGAAVARAEATRLAGLVELARAKGLAPAPAPGEA